MMSTGRFIIKFPFIINFSRRYVRTEKKGPGFQNFFFLSELFFPFINIPAAKEHNKKIFFKNSFPFINSAKIIYFY